MTASPTLVPSAVAVLDPYVRAGVFEPSEVHVAATVARLGVQVSDLVILAVAVAARGPRLGHACVDLADVERLVVDTDEEQVSGLDWPGLDVWSEALAASDVVADPQRASLEPFLPLVWDGRRLYLQRYWDYEVTVADDLRARALSGVPATVETDAVGPALDRFFGPDDPVEPDLQRAAVRTALTHRVSVIAGGPGTGKTHTIAALLTALRQMPGPGGGTLRVALAAPTGKAAARMTEAVQQEAAVMAAGGDILEGVTLHRLLGWAPGTQFRHDRRNPLPYDVVIVDETSMVSLPLMAHLLSAMPPSARLVLVGDPFQLASIEAGSVLGDVVGPSSAGGKDNDGSPLSGRITTLRRMRRFTTGSSIAELSMAVREGDAARALGVMSNPDAHVRWIRPHDEAALAEVRQTVAQAGVEVVDAAAAGDAERGLAAASRIKVLCATRHGASGLYRWSADIEADVAALLPEFNRYAAWYVGRPVMVTANDHVTKVNNGDVGLVIRRAGAVEVALPDGSGFRYLSPSRLDRVESWWAMTIHKSQGSEYPHAVLSLPDAGSAILTRELLYTGVTRAREQLTVVASEEALRSAIDRPITRASGLRDRLWPSSA